MVTQGRISRSRDKRRRLYIDGRFYGQPLSGIQRYAAQIVQALDALVGEGRVSAQVTLVLPTGTTAPDLANIAILEHGPFRGHAWVQSTLAWAARDGVLISLAASGPIVHPRQIAVIHDAAVFRHPDFYSRSYGMLHRTMDRLLARRAHIATVSRFSQSELADVLHLPVDRIAVVPNGAEHLRIEPDVTVIDRLGLVGQPFFLILGSLTRNKNLAVAVRALARLGAGQAKLVAVGSLDRSVFGQALPAATDDLLLAGRLSDAEIAGLMHHARALLFPSIYEGFGIPPLEAMVNHCPVIASTAPAVREVCSDAADYFDANDDRRLADLMRASLSEPDAARQRRIEAGVARASLFTWRASALKLVELFDRIDKKDAVA